MADIINLNRFRKRKLRDEKTARAETNRNRDGRTRSQRCQEASTKQLERDRHDGHRRYPDDGPIRGSAGRDASRALPLKGQRESVPDPAQPDAAEPEPAEPEPAD
ncbi:MAG: DUF4169 family protein [Nannocystaceae bacterium]